MRINKYKILKAFGNYAVNTEVNVMCDDKNIPLDAEWRRRLRDSITDSCIKLVTDSSEVKETPKPDSEEVLDLGVEDTKQKPKRKK